jgi:hypothetical protein
MLALRSSGRLLGRGLDSIDIRLDSAAGSMESTLTPTVLEAVGRFLSAKSDAARTIDGQLLMGDFKPSSLRCRIHPPLARPITCSFSPELQPKVLNALTRFVRVVGQAHETGGVLTSFTIGDLRVLGSAEPYLSAIEAGEQLASDWQTTIEIEPPRASLPALTDLKALADSQNIKPVLSHTALRGGYWPDEDDADSFNTTVRQWRHEEQP